jgi:MoaA/NifB/PqqE/SkfB family radical SAM enzyme
MKLNFPVPKPDMGRYDAMLKSGFETYPKRMANYETYRDSAKSATVGYMPIKADIENVSRCNLRCGHCLVSSMDGQKRAEDLSFEDFKLFIDEQYGLVEIKMQGVGEPFLQKEFVEMVKYATDRHIWVRTTTNGTLLHKNENYKRIIDANVGEIQVSFDGATKETQEKIRVGSNFEQIVENCQKLNGYCDEIGTDMTRMWSVLQTQNYDEAEALLDIAKHMGFKRLTISMELRDWNDVGSIKVDNNDKRLGGDLTTQDWVDFLIKKATAIELDLSFWHVSDRFSSANICFWPFERLLLSSDGYIVPCCLIADPSIFNFGKYENFADIWNGQAMVDFRTSHIEGYIPAICMACYS